MEKDILQELDILQQTKCVDKNLTNTFITIPNTYITQELNVIDDFYKDKTVNIVGFLPSGEYEILSNTNNEIVIDYEEIVFSLIQEQPLPPEPELPPVLFNSLIQFKINCDDLDLTDDILVDDRKLIVSAETIISTVFTITANTHNTITISGDFNIELSNLVLQRSLEFEALFAPFKALMNTANDRTLTKFECPTNNSFFAKYDIFTDIMIGYKNTYKIQDKMNDIIGLLNDFLKIDISNYSTKYELEPYFTETQSKISLIYSTIDDWTAYFERLKKLMSKMRIADAQVEEENCQNMYDAKPIESQEIIDTMFNTYVDFGREAYTEYKQELMFEIKID